MGREEFSAINDIIKYSVSMNELFPAVVWKDDAGRTNTKIYADLFQNIQAFSSVLSDLCGLGSKIALSGSVSYEWISAMLGIVYSGMIALPIDRSPNPAAICSKADALKADIFIAGKGHPGICELAREVCPNLRYIISMEAPKSKGMILSFRELSDSRIFGAGALDGSSSYGAFDKAGQINAGPDSLCLFASDGTGSDYKEFTHNDIVQEAVARGKDMDENCTMVLNDPCTLIDLISGIYAGAKMCLL